MNKVIVILLVCVCSIFASVYPASGQEYVGPLGWNPQLFKNSEVEVTDRSARKTAAALTLPFFEDFTGYDVFPDTYKWADHQVYINNTMGAGTVSRGVATFDALNSHGLPWDSYSNINFRYADSLTSRPIDLSASTIGDSIYFSFFYQPQGNGFYPLLQDSLILFFKNKYGGFVKIWTTPGASLRPFQQVMIPMTDTLFYHSDFTFRFVNKAALYWADAVWNVDYIRMDRNRSAGDTTLTDVGFTSDPTFLLNDYSFMPYNQFMANPAGELATHVADSIRNSGPSSQMVNYSFKVTDDNGGAVLSSGGSPSAVPFTGYQSRMVNSPLSIPSFPVYPPDTRVVFNSTYSLSAPFSGRTANDTIVKQQVFDNYLAYDDGTAEKSYFLVLSPTLDGRIAVEYHLNQPDTLRGMAIYFGRQAPVPNYMTFNIFVYSALAGINGAGADAVLDSQEFYVPAYTDSQNQFWIYTFDQPLVLPAGTFYAGTQQPAASGDDTLYFGLDVNRIGGNHAYYNVLHAWDPSLISGAIMMRPVLGRYVASTSIDEVSSAGPKWQAIPNPAQDVLNLQMGESQSSSLFRLTDMLGHTLLQGRAVNAQTIDISMLVPGMYLLNIITDGVAGAPQKILKL